MWSQGPRTCFVYTSHILREFWPRKQRLCRVVYNNTLRDIIRCILGSVGAISKYIKTIRTAALRKQCHPLSGPKISSDRAFSSSSWSEQIITALTSISNLRIVMMKVSTARNSHRKHQRKKQKATVSNVWDEYAPYSFE